MNYRNENGKMGYFLSDEEFGVLYQAQKALDALCYMLHSLNEQSIEIEATHLGRLLDYPAEALGNILENLK